MAMNLKELTRHVNVLKISVLSECPDEINMVILAFMEDGAQYIFLPVFENAEEKQAIINNFIIWGAIRGLESMAILSGMWYVPYLKDYDPETTPMPSEHADRREGVITAYFPADEEQSILVEDVIRNSDGKIISLTKSSMDCEGATSTGFMSTLLSEARRLREVFLKNPKVDVLDVTEVWGTAHTADGSLMKV